MDRWVLPIELPGRMRGKKNLRSPGAFDDGYDPGSCFDLKEWLDLRKKSRHSIRLDPEWKEYAEACAWPLEMARRAARSSDIPMPFTQAVWVKMLYFPEDHRRLDLSAALETAGDLLQSSGIIENDRQILCWDGSRILAVDKLKPRALIEVRPYVPAPNEYMLKEKRERSKRNRRPEGQAQRRDQGPGRG